MRTWVQALDFTDLFIGVYAFLDTLVSQMWLPLNVCNVFEKAFNLSWNATEELYVLSASQHAALLQQNPTFTFSIGPSSSGGVSTNIVLPYAAFDLTVNKPWVNSTRKYSPLKRASKASQYTLGRVFFQEAYVAADYDRRNVSVSQARLSNRQLPQDLVAIEPPNEQSETPSRLGRNAIAGIAVAAVLAFGLVVWFAYLAHKRWRTRRADRNAHISAGKDDSGGVGIDQVTTVGAKELAVTSDLKELNATDAEVHEPDSRTTPSELPLANPCDQVFELDSGEVLAMELGTDERSRVRDDAKWEC